LLIKYLEMEMSRCSIPSALALASLLLGATVSCSFGPSRIKQPSINASSAGKLAMEEYDTNHDGKVAGDELEKAPGLKAALPRLDTDKDGGVSADEVAARVNSWKAMESAMISVPCRVTLDGQPLVGATVTFEPEAFLGENIKTAFSTTNAQGNVSPIIPKEQRPDPTLPGGANLGLYKVRISKMVDGKETIPARYNTETTLGQEVSDDDPGMKSMNIKFDLKSGS
jgi:hypothetical protein